ncbi:hypothetical protein EG327_002963 [Venturia inaequalis]|uniref:Maltose/galactoside acetyltransferase domain-containing protein n=1 Tax=Venturia inaequalis TaxID=5025 RepID=A0A8H3VK24_VENIN|nr:hypothetical protein EG327_002963 [Venturia inaequalis]
MSLSKESMETMMKSLNSCEEYGKMLRGELYYSFGPEMSAARRRCAQACKKFNRAAEEEDITRRHQVQLWRNIVGNTNPLPPQAATPEEDEALFVNEPYVGAPVRVDYGIHLTVGPGTMMNFNFVVLDTCRVTIGARVLFGPNVSIFSASHPLDSKVRNGLVGPEFGKEIHIGDDCWVGGNVIFLAGVTIGRGCTIGAGSVVTKSVEPFTVVAGNPARVIKKSENTWEK